MADVVERFVPPEPAAPGERFPIAVLVSGSGTTLQNFLNEQACGRLAIDIRRVISSRADVYGLDRARRAGIEATVLEPRAFSSEEALSEAVFAACDEAGARLCCMAGYLAHLPIPDRWLGRVLNIHPSLLPAFGGKGLYGVRVHRAVLEYGCRISGCTVHVADQIYDHGPVVIQRHVPVLLDDTPEGLRERVYHEECLAYPRAIRLFAEGRIRFEGRRALLVRPRRA